MYARAINLHTFCHFVKYQTLVCRLVKPAHFVTILVMKVQNFCILKTSIHESFFFLSLTHLSFVFIKSLVFKRIECVIRLSCYCYRVRLVSGFAVQVQRTSFFTTILI